MQSIYIDVNHYKYWHVYDINSALEILHYIFDILMKFYKF